MDFKFFNILTTTDHTICKREDYLKWYNDLVNCEVVGNFAKKKVYDGLPTFGWISPFLRGGEWRGFFKYLFSKIRLSLINYICYDDYIIIVDNT